MTLAGMSKVLWEHRDEFWQRWSHLSYTLKCRGCQRLQKEKEGLRKCS